MTTIGPSLVITGQITSQEDITVHGRVNGQIQMDDGALVVAPTGHVDADVQGHQVMVHGTMAGNVLATGRVELTDTAEVTGTLTTPAVVLRDGAMFNGLIEVDRKSPAGKPKPARAATAAEPAKSAT
jgi:cytoskeletal protein CcmA (bactofilin family)